MEAVQRGYSRIVVALLEKGADVNKQTSFGTTALDLAIEHGNEQVP